ncbi:MAG: PEP-utilizing enzyme, partial [Actinomycetota bacterium]|nr:PEP-utilizing enzyme [Actinomycetota bacterium]
MTTESTANDAGATKGAAAVRTVVRAVVDGSMTREQAVAAVSPLDIEHMLHSQFDVGGSAITKGLGASPGAAVGAAYFSPDAAVDAYDAGDDVILVRVETSPEDVHGMAIAEGILTTRGGLAS